MPKLLETFNQLKMSSEIRSSDRFPLILNLLNQWLILKCINDAQNAQNSREKTNPLKHNNVQKEQDMLFTYFCPFKIMAFSLQRNLHHSINPDLVLRDFSP